MPAKVVDASVLGVLLFGEPRAQEAYELLEGSELYAPALIDYELASIARKKILQYPSHREALVQMFRIGLALDLNRVEVDQEAVLQLALDTGLTTYDASYLFLSRELGIPLVTFDRQLRTASSPSGGGISS